MTEETRRGGWAALGLLLFGVVCCSTSAIFIKLSDLDPELLSSLRLLMAALLLAPLFERARRRHGVALGWAALRRSLIPAALLSAHLVTWTMGARGTLAANASLIVNLVPLVMPLVLFLVTGEKVRRIEIVATGLGLGGVLVLFAGDLDTGNARGNVLCLVAMVLLAFYLAFGSRNRDVPSIWLYVVPLYALAGLMSLIWGAPRIGVLGALPAREWWLLVALAVVPTIFGHSSLNGAMKYFPAGVVSVCNVSQAVFAGLMAWPVFDEVPHGSFWPGMLLIGAGASLALWGARTPRASLA